MSIVTIEEEFPEIVNLAPDWPKGEQFKRISFDHQQMAWWLFHARCDAPGLRLGSTNWPVMVRSLVDRVVELEVEIEELKAALEVARHG